MGSKHEALTKEEVDAVRIPCRVANELDRLCRAGRSRSNIRVLDLGCGRGAMVLSLLRQGFDAYGVEIDKGPVQQGREAFAAEGFFVDEHLRLARSGVWPFDSAMFDLVISNQVLEHVADLDAVAREVARVTVLGGWGWHCFPAKYVKIEPHVFVPYVHWLPKTQMRHWWLRWQAHRLPAWQGHDLLNMDQRIDAFYDYLNQKTYYRSNRKIRAVFEGAGLETKFDSPLVGSRKKRVWIGWLRAWRYRTFHDVTLIMRRHETQSNSLV